MSEPRSAMAARRRAWAIWTACATAVMPMFAPAQDHAAVEHEPSAYRINGEPLFAPTPSSDLLKRAHEHQQAYLAKPNDPDRLIWHGRFLAYQGRYREAIAIFTRGIERFPADARMLRHRGHRYITMRQFDKAIADFDLAIKLIDGTPNEVEPDGMPNAKNIPISTLHGNIYYHKGLAHYLRQEWEDALRAYQDCLALKSNDDNTVSATHWIYMIHRRMNNDEAAQRVLEPIHPKMQIIENFSYHRACLFYKGRLPIEELAENGDDEPASDAVRYAIANWHYCNGDVDRARRLCRAISAGGTWASFGHIVAEVDLVSALTEINGQERASPHQR